VKIALQDDTGNDQIQGDYIGPDISGTQAYPTPALGDGLEIGFNGIRSRSAFSSNNLIGGTTPAARNLISANTGLLSTDGILFASGTGLNNVVQGNLIGTDRSGTKALHNGSTGVEIGTDGNTVGGAASGAGNVISGNTVCINVRGNKTVIQNNAIGTDPSGTLNVGNTDSGIGVSFGPGTQIVGNTVAFNGSAGVGIVGGHHRPGPASGCCTDGKRSHV
jgi:hypothetical protein